MVRNEINKIFKNELLSEILEEKFGIIKCQLLSQNKKYRECYLVDKTMIPLVFAVTFFSSKKISGVEPVEQKIREGELIGKTFKKYGWQLSKHLIEISILSLPVWLQNAFNSKTKIALSNFYELKIRSGEGAQASYAFILEIYSPSIVPVSLPHTFEENCR